MSIYQFSKYDENRIMPWCPTDSRRNWHENSKKYPNDKTILYYKQNPIEYKFNNYGFRTPDDFNDVDEGNIFLGCSYTIGIGHHLENTWSYKVNEHIGGKFWNLSQGGSGVATAFRLLYGFKDYLKVKNIFHFAPTLQNFRYEFIIRKLPIIINVGHRYAKKLVGDKFVNESLMDIDFAKLEYDKSVCAIKSLANKMGCNYYFLDEGAIKNFKDDDSIGARDFLHNTINEQNHLYESFLKIIEKNT